CRQTSGFPQGMVVPSFSPLAVHSVIEDRFVKEPFLIRADRDQKQFQAPQFLVLHAEGLLLKQTVARAAEHQREGLSPPRLPSSRRGTQLRRLNQFHLQGTHAVEVDPEPGPQVLGKRRQGKPSEHGLPGLRSVLSSGLKVGFSTAARGGVKQKTSPRTK